MVPTDGRMGIPTLSLRRISQSMVVESPFRWRQPMQMMLSRLCMVMVVLIITLITTLQHPPMPAQTKLPVTSGYLLDPNLKQVGSADLEVINVKDGAGAAVLKSPSTFELDAGSTGNTIQIDFTTPGTMDGGQVLLEMPPADTWDALQTTNDAGVNYISIAGFPSRATPRTTSIGDDFALVYFEKFGVGDTLRFTIENVTSQSDIETTAFRILSQGSAAAGLTPLTGADNPTGYKADDSSTHDLLLGAVYAAPFDFDGVDGAVATEIGALRIKVTGGGDGSGAVTVDIVESTEGLNTYLIADDDGVFEPQRKAQVHAGDDSTYIQFTYTAQETIADGELRFTAPAGRLGVRCRSISHGRPVIRLPM